MKYFSIRHRKELVSIATALISYFIFLISSRIYVYTDNITVAVVLNGFYGDNNYCQYIHPFLCLLIKALIPLFPSADMFTVICHLLIFIEICLLTYIVLETISRTESYQTNKGFIFDIIAIIAVFFMFNAINIWDINYSVQAASFVFTGTLILLLGKELDKGRCWIVLGTIYISFGFMLRLGAACLFFPYIGLIIITEIIDTDNKKDACHKIVKYVLPALLCIAVIIVSRQVFYSIEPYATAQKYNTYRTVIEDYPMEMYGAYSSDFTGIEKTEYECARAWVLFDTENLNADKLKKIAEVGSIKKGYNSFGVLSAAVWKSLVQTDIQLVLLMAATCILAIRNVVITKSVWRKLESLFAMIGTIIIMYYITWSGRALLRVWQSALFAADAVLINGAVCDYYRKPARQSISRSGDYINTAAILLLCTVFWFGLGQYIAHAEIHAPYTALTAKENADDSVYSDTFNGDCIYLWPNWYATIPDFFSSIDKLPTRRVIEHNIPVGDWTYGQVYFNNYLHKVNADNPARALLERPNTYLMGDIEMINNYLRVHFGDNLKLIEAGEVRGEKAFKVIIEKK